MINFKQQLSICCSFCKWKRSYAIKDLKNEENADKNTQDENKEPFWKRRYLLALHGFAIYFLLNAHRINMSVAIVAMVDFSEGGNHTIPHISNTTTEKIDELRHDQHPIKYNWSPKVQGAILGAGFFGYVLSLIIGGKLAEAFGPRIMLIIGTFLSSFCTMVTPFTASVSPYFLMFIQCVRGIGQGFMFPAMAVLAANWFPKAERGLLSGLALSGYICGLLLAGIFSSLICESISMGGWPAVFYIFGGFGVFISMIQFFSLKSLPKDDPRISRAELNYILKNQENKLTLKRPAVPWRKILCSMPTYALLFATFGQYWLGVHFLSVHATFLATILHYPMAENGILISLPYILSMIFNVSSSFFSSFLIARNYLSLSTIRKSWNLIGAVVYSLCVALMIFTNAENTVTIVSSIISIAIMGLANSGVMVTALDMTPTFAGSLTGLSTTFASFAGFVLPVVCGVMTNEEQTVEQWNKFFILSIVIVLSSAIFFCIFGSAEIQSYNSSVEEVCSKTEKGGENGPKSVELKEPSEISNHT